MTMSQTAEQRGPARTGLPQGRQMAAEREATLPRRRFEARHLAKALGVFSLALGAAQLFAPRAVARAAGLRDGRLMPLFGLRETATGAGLLLRKRPATFAWARVGGDVMDIAALLAAMDERGARRGRLAASAAAVTGVLAIDYVAARLLAEKPAGDAVDGGSLRRFRQSVAINRPAEELYRFWRDFENVPKVIKHVTEVKRIDDRRSRWTVQTPEGLRIVFETEVTEDKPGRRIAWRSLPEADIANSGSISFEPAPGGRGTLVAVEMAYQPPGGAVGAFAARLLGASAQQLMDADLRPFKQLMETGEIATTRGQPAGRASGLGAYDRLIRA